MIWQLSHRADLKARLLADRHYNRQHIGSPQFVPPGRCLVLWCESAVWVTSWPFAEYVKHAWAGAWMNSLFRRESGPRASEMIKEAIQATRAYWPEVPTLGMVTFVDAGKVRSENPGCCYLKAGFKRVGKTKGGLVALQLLPAEMPEPVAAIGTQLKW